MFVIKKIALFLSMILLGYVGEDIEDARPLFITWFIYLLLIVIDYIEMYTLKKFEKAQRKVIILYLTGIIIFGILTFISLLGSFGVIVLSDTLHLEPDADNVIVEGLFFLTFGNNISIEAFVMFSALCVVVFFVLEFFTKPYQTYEEKHKVKYSKRGGVAS